MFKNLKNLSIYLSIIYISLSIYLSFISIYLSIYLIFYMHDIFLGEFLWIVPLSNGVFQWSKMKVICQFYEAKHFLGGGKW